MDILQLKGKRQLVSLISEYMESKKTSEQVVGFNIFPAISDTFYRENFHSDILKAFLSTHIGDKYEFGYHFEGDRFLQVFIEMINASRAKNGQSPIDRSLYQKTVVEREPHRIDILIKGNGHCIIIENKINDAVDMDRQLPRYYEKMQEDGYTVDAVVYLTKTPEKTPDLRSWDLNDKEAILPLISIIPANDEAGEISLLNNWIKTCCEKAQDPDCISSLRQYGALVEHLTPEFKEAKAIRELLAYLYDHPSELKEENLPVEILQKIPVEMAREIREDVRKLIRNKGLTLTVGSWSTNSCVINLDNADNQIWVYCCTDKEAAFRLGFRGRWHDYDTATYQVSWYPMSEQDVEVKVDQNGAYLAKDFKFGKEDEQELLNFISKLLDFAEKNLV